MSALHSNVDSCVHDIEAALRQARVARRYLHGTIIPALPPVRRTFAEHIIRQIDRDAIFDEVLVRDLETFIGLIEREIAVGIHAGWEADENHVKGGWEVVIRDERAAALEPAAVELKQLQLAIARVIDAAKATRLADTLIDE